MKKFIVSFVLIFCIIFGMTNISNAASLNLTLGATQTEVKQKGEIYVSIKLDNFSEGSNGINVYKAKIEYDKNIFEEIDSSNFICKNNWLDLEYNIKNGEFIVIKKVGVTSEEEVVQIRLNVKENAKVGKTTITVKDIVTSEGKEDIECIAKNIGIRINGNVTNNSSDKNNQNSNTNNKDDSVTITDIPYTGKGYTGTLLMIINVILIIVAILCYKKQKEITKKENKRLKNILRIVIILALAVPTISSVNAAYEYIYKGDINSDNQIDYSDTKLLEKHLIGLIELSEEQAKTADMNNDGKLTVTDLSLLVIKVEKWLNYELQVNKVSTEKYYYEKNEEVGILLNATVNYGGEVKKVVINGQEYDVEKLTTDEYRIFVNASETSGIQEFKITKALLDNKKYVEIDNKVEIDILKQVPVAENYEFNEDLTNKNAIVKFNIVDKDKAIEDVKAQLIDDSDNTVYEENLNIGSNELKIEIEEEKEYILKIIANYDRDTNSLKNLPKEDNKFENEILLEKNVILISDYELKISNQATYKEDNESKYFNKNEEIKLGFESSNKTDLEPTSLKINDKEYEITKNKNIYFATLDGYSESGVKEIEILSITLSNGKQLNVSENNSCKIDILKEKPEVTEFEYKENDNGNGIVSFKLKDDENALKENKKVIITSEKGSEVLNKAIQIGENSFEFKISANTEKYTVKIIADYDLDTNTFEEEANSYINKILLNEEIDFGRRAIEMKDISSIELYEQKNGKVEQVKTLDVSSDIDISKYIVKINMKDMPGFYANIKETKIENSELKFTLDYENIVQYKDGEKQESLQVVFGNVKDDIATGNSFSILIEQIKANPSGNFELTSDIDASDITTDYIFIDEFTGTLNGNGYTITNVTKPLFNNLQNATIKNLVLENVNLSGVRGTIANNATDTNIENVHIKNLIMKTGIDQTGSFIGILRTGSSINESSASNIKISGGNKRTGGLVGAMANATINNSYVQGTFNCTNDGIGGIAGSGENNSKITNCISLLELNLSAGPGYNGGIIGHSMNVILTNNVSLSNGSSAYRIHGTGIHANSSNNYELEESELKANADGTKIILVKSADINKEFYLNTVTLSDNIWNLDDVDDKNLPTLKNADPNLETNSKNEQINKELYIPEYERLQKLENFDNKKEILYANLYKLMPFYDAKYYVLDSKDISTDNILNKKVIKEILAINKDNELVVALSNSTYKDLEKIKVVFEDDTVNEYKLSYNNYYGNVVSYKINEVGLIYNFDKYILNESLDVITELSTYIKGLDYTSELDPLTEAEDSRLYRDYFNETISNEATEMVLKLLENSSDYTLTIDNEILNTKITNELITDGKLKEYIYAYNYYKRWYDIEIAEVAVNDIIMFEGQLFTDSMTVKNTVNEVIISTSNKNTGATQTFYANNIAKYTGYSDIGKFLDYLIITIGEYKDSNDWFTDNYKGIVYEVAIKDKPEIEYRAWRQLKNRSNCVLPVLTLPANSAYILSSPTQFLIGAQRIYITNPDDETQRDELKEMIKAYGQNVESFYTTASGYIPSERFNLYTDLQIDHRFTKNAGGTSEYQSPNTTNEPFHKNFNEAIGWWANANGSAAYANGNTVYWNAYPALTSFSIWTHETGHNQDGKIFLNGNGRRGWAEDYADGNTTQGGDDGGINFNLTYTYDMSSNVTTNLTPERINTEEKIYSYYKGMFEASDFLDYIEAKAFLSLTPEEQAKVAVQVYYPNKENGSEEEKLAGDEVTGYRVLDAATFEKMNLQTIKDLWDNQIVIKPGVTGNTTVGTNLYGGSNIYTINWYQPHNDNGRPDSYNFKRLAWEMLGIAGYHDGYVTYYSNISANDLDAIRKVTDDDTMTWEKYKLNRYQMMQDNWDNMKYLDADDILEQYTQALKTDAENNDRNVTASTNVKRMNYHYLKRATNDFEEEVFGSKSNVVHIKTAEEFQTLISNKQNGCYILDNDIDMSSLSGEKAIIEGTFTGNLDGNGYRIIGNRLPIFENIKFSYINNLVIEDSQISMTDKEAGALSKTMYYSKLKDVHVINVSVTADSRAGGIVGYSIQNFIEQCSADATVIATGNAVGAFMGEINNSSVKDCYSTGYVKGRQDMGGFVGWADSTNISNCYSLADTESIVTNGNGGFIGQARNSTKVKNCVAFGNVINGYKFDGRTAADKFINFENNYEYEEATGISTLTRTDVDFTNKITILTKDNLYLKSFYTENLGWDSDIWDFSELSEEKLPKLKNE